MGSGCCRLHCSTLVNRDLGVITATLLTSSSSFPAVTHNWRVVRFPEMRWVSSAQGQTEFMARFLSH